MREELKPCPFCGSRDIDPEGWMAGAPGVLRTGPACTGCGASAEDTAAWNTRAEPQGGVGADSGLAAADNNPQRDVPRDEEGRDAYQIIAEGNRQALLRRAGVKDRSREPLLGPPRDMLVSRILLEALPDIDPKQADQLAVKINDAIPADDNHKALVDAVQRLQHAVLASEGTKADADRRQALKDVKDALAAFQSRQEEK